MVKIDDYWLRWEADAAIIMSFINLHALSENDRVILVVIIDRICLTSVTRAKPKEKMAFSA